MKKRFYKVYEYILCEVISEPIPSRFGGTTYRVKRRDTDQKGGLICSRQLAIGQEVLCNVGDSDENGDNMVLIIHDSSDYDRYKNVKLSAEDLQKLNEAQDLRYGEFRAELERKELERIRKKKASEDQDIGSSGAGDVK